MLQQAYRFKLDGEPIFYCRYGSGHINDTYLLVDSTARQYILQRINKIVFWDPESLMKNIAAVTSFLRKKATSHREVLFLIPTTEGNSWLLDENGDYWRMYQFISDSICMNQAETVEDFRQSALAFGRFQCDLADFDTDILTETIPNFHDTPGRYLTLKEAVEEDRMGRVKDARKELAFAMEREEYAGVLTNLLDSGQLPVRVTHNDTKLNNVLFDRETRKALCVIDLDTVMPGLAVNDYGDSIRFGASTAAEDEQDLSKVNFSFELFKAYTSGFLSVCGSSLTKKEIESMRDGAKMMTLECGVRFLTDYIKGDVYFNISRPNHNLDRCRTQFKLVEDIEKNWSKMQEFILGEVNL